MPRRFTVALLAVAAIAVSAIGAASASAEKVKPLINSTLVGSLPSDPMIHGVAAGSAPWALKASTFNVASNGLVVVAVKGLVIPALGTPGPVNEVDAAIYCGADMTAAATTKSVTLNKEGDAVIVDKVALPERCFAPQVLINPNMIPAIYIAAGGFNLQELPQFPVPILNTTLAGSLPSDPVLHGVTAGGAPWVVKASTFNLLSNGVVVVAVKGLVIPALGTPGPVNEIDAAIYCGADTAPAAMTKSVKLNEEGDARIIDKVALPTRCVAPQILINPNQIGSLYIAGNGFA
jgi:hypothetical protein